MKGARWQGGVGWTQQEHVAPTEGQKRREEKRGAERLGHSTPQTHTKNPPHPTLPQKSPHPSHTLLQYSDGEAGDEGRAVVGRGGTQNKNTWRPPEGQKTGRGSKKKHPCAPPPPAPATTRTLPCTGATRHGNAHYCSFPQAWHVHGRSWQDQEERGASGARGGAAPHHFRQRGVSESADTYRVHPHVRRYSALHCASQHPFQTT